MRPRRFSLLVVLLAVAVIAASCGDDADTSAGAATDTSDSGADLGGSTSEPPAEPVACPAPAIDGSAERDLDFPEVEAPREDVPSVFDEGFESELFPDPLVDTTQILSGGPPPDGIPAIDDPKFDRVAAVDWLCDNEPVQVLVINGDARAYPLQVMTWHELVNDVVGDVPVTISYCPLCNSGLAYDRRLGDRLLDFGTSGMLLNSSLVMFDRQTESLWSHFTGQAIVGHLTGTQLETLAMATASWSDFRDAYPDGLVLNRDTGHSRRYGENPYPGYDDVNQPPFLFRGPVGDQLPAAARVLVVRGDGPAVALSHDRLAAERVIPFEAQGRSLVAVLEPGTASALDNATIAGGRDVGATGVFVPELDGAPINLTPADGGGFRDEGSGSTFDVFGRALDGPLAGQRLEEIEHLDTFWFAIGAFDPDLELLTG